jgi:hypothetical protein
MQFTGIPEFRMDVCFSPQGGEKQAGGGTGGPSPPPEKFWGFEATKWGVLRLFRAGFGWKLGANFTKGRAKLAKVVRKVRILGNSIRKKFGRTGSVWFRACEYEFMVSVPPKIYGAGSTLLPFANGAQLPPFNCVRPLRALKFCPNWAKFADFAWFLAFAHVYSRNHAQNSPQM